MSFGSKSRYAINGIVSSALLVCGLAIASPSRGPAMPFDVPGDLHELEFGHRIALSSSGRLVAYMVHEKLRVSNGFDRIMPNRVLGSVPIARIFVSDVRTASRRQIAKAAGNCWRPVFSPDESLLASYCDGGGSAQLWVHDLQTGASRRLTDAPMKPSLWMGDEPLWTPDGNELIVPLAPEEQAQDTAVVAESSADPNGLKANVIVQRSGTIGEKPAGESAQVAAGQSRKIDYMFSVAVGAVNVKTGAVRVVVPENAAPRPSAMLISPSGKWISYISVPYRGGAQQGRSSVDVAVAPINGGAVTPIAANLVRPENSYLVGASFWHPTRDQLFWIKDGGVWAASAADGFVQHRLASSVSTAITNSLAITRDGKAVVVGVDPADDPIYSDPHPQGLAFIPIDGSSPTILRAPKGFALERVLKDYNGILWQPKTDRISVRLREDAAGKLVIGRFDVRSGKMAVLWQGHAMLDVIGTASANSGMLGIYEDTVTPSDIYLFDADFANPKRISHVEPRLDGFSFAQPVVFNTPVKRLDGAGDSVRSALYMPDGTKPGDRLPTIVFVYPRSTARTGQFGGGYPQTLPASVFTTRGYAVLLTEMPVLPLGKVSPSIINDILGLLTPQINQAAKLGYVDLSRLAVSGQSFGGYTTVSLLAATDMFRAGIALAGVYDLTYLSSFMGKNRDFGYFPGTVEQYWNLPGGPWTDINQYIAMSPFFQADRIKTPLLIVEGSVDIAPEDARKMFNALKLLGKTVEYAEYVGEGHFPSAWAPANAADLSKRAVEFLDLHVKPARAKSSQTLAQ